MKVSSNAIIFTLVGVQIVMFVCLFLLLHRVNKLESNHEESGHEKRYTFKKEK